METFDFGVWLIEQAPVIVVLVGVLWLQRKDYKESLKAKDEVISSMSSEAREERQATFELMGAIKQLMESINKKL